MQKSIAATVGEADKAEQSSSPMLQKMPGGNGMKKIKRGGGGARVLSRLAEVVHR